MFPPVISMAFIVQLLQQAIIQLIGWQHQQPIYHHSMVSLTSNKRSAAHNTTQRTSHNQQHAISTHQSRHWRHAIQLSLPFSFSMPALRRVDVLCCGWLWLWLWLLLVACCLLLVACCVCLCLCLACGCGCGCGCGGVGVGAGFCV